MPLLRKRTCWKKWIEQRKTTVSLQKYEMFSQNILCRIHLQRLRPESQSVHHQNVGEWQWNAGNLTLFECPQRHRNGSVKKKENVLSRVNKEYFKTHSSGKIRVEMDEMWSFYHDKSHQIWLWWAIDHYTGEAVAYWFGSREHCNLDKLLELLSPLNLGTVYTDGNYAYYERVDSEVLVVSKKNTQKIERKHLSLRTWCSRLVRKGIRFSKKASMHKICVGLVINVLFFGYHWLIQ
jgi:insertion element IS1 protein InsB